jgi:hypothetical protein
MNTFIAKNWEFIVGVIGSLGIFFSGLKLKFHNEKTTELENLKTVRIIEKDLLNDMKIQIEELVKLNNYLKDIVEVQTKQLSKYQKQYGEI